MGMAIGLLNFRALLEWEVVAPMRLSVFHWSEVI